MNDRDVFFELMACDFNARLAVPADGAVTLRAGKSLVPIEVPPCRHRLRLIAAHDEPWVCVTRFAVVTDLTTFPSIRTFTVGGKLLFLGGELEVAPSIAPSRWAVYQYDLAIPLLGEAQSEHVGEVVLAFRHARIDGALAAVLLDAIDDVPPCFSHPPRGLSR